MRDVRTGPKRPVRTFSIFGGAVAALRARDAGAASPASQRPATPLRWLSAARKAVLAISTEPRRAPAVAVAAGRQAALLIDCSNSAELDGLGPNKYRPDALRERGARGASGKSARRSDARTRC